MDVIERAQEREAHDRLLALEAQRRRARMPRRASGNGMCIDCDHAIEPRRMEVLGPDTLRCAHCARDAESPNGRSR